MGDSDSEDSDEEGGLGNVNRVLIRPPGHSGKAKKGHLCFDASFETGNLGRVDLISEFEYDLFIRPDTCSPKFRLWFNFTVDNFKHDQRVIFNIINISKTKNLFRDCMTPLVKSTSRPKWQRIPSQNVWYHRSGVHQSHHILSFAFAFDHEEEVFQFAMAAPYSYSRLQAYLSALDHRVSPMLQSQFEIKQIASSVQERKIELITIGKFPDYSMTKDKKRVIVILARIHPGEPPSSFICQGLLDLMTSSHQIAETLREHVLFKVIPMLNPDGVFLGNYRSTLMGFDLNRSWHIASPWAHPSLWAVLQMLKGIENNEFFQLDFIVDLHAQPNVTGAFIYGNSYEDIYRYERHIVFPKLLATNADDYTPLHTMYNADTAKVGTARRHLCTILNDRVNCYTLQVSLYGHQTSPSEPIIPYTEESYMCLGRNLTRTFLDYYRLMGVIPVAIPRENILTRRRPHTHRTKSRSPASARTKPRPKTTQRCHANISYMDIITQDLDDLEYEYQSYPNSLYTKRSRHKFDVELSSNMSRRGTKSALTDDLKSSVSTKPVGGGGFTRKPMWRHTSPSSQAFILSLPPSLTIIDFNQLTRGGLDQAVGKLKKKKKVEKGN